LLQLVIGFIVFVCTRGQGKKNCCCLIPQLIHCRFSECSKLWKEQSSDEGWVLPAQIRLDTVNDEITGLTAVYEKSVSTQEIRAAIDSVYGKSRMATDSDKLWLWRVEPQQLAIQLAAEKMEKTN